MQLHYCQLFTLFEIGQLEGSNLKFTLFNNLQIRLSVKAKSLTTNNAKDIDEAEKKIRTKKQSQHLHLKDLIA